MWPISDPTAGLPSAPNTSASPCSQHGEHTLAELAPLQHKEGFLYIILKLRSLSFKLFLNNFSDLLQSGKGSSNL